MTLGNDEREFPEIPKRLGSPLSVVQSLDSFHKHGGSV
jgi:hypothetical protein